MIHDLMKYLGARGNELSSRKFQVSKHTKQKKLLNFLNLEHTDKKKQYYYYICGQTSTNVYSSAAMKLAHKKLEDGGGAGYHHSLVQKGYI